MAPRAYEFTTQAGTFRIVFRHYCWDLLLDHTLLERGYIRPETAAFELATGLARVPAGIASIAATVPRSLAMWKKTELEAGCVGLQIPPDQGDSYARSSKDAQ